MSYIHEHISECGGTFSGMSAEFTSWNYPHNYTNNMRCVYNIQVPHGYDFCVLIEDIELGDTYDKLEFFLSNER